MGKQKGPLFVTGTYNGICYYKMDGEYYFRKKSSLDGKRVKRDKRFTLTMVYAGILGQASALAGEIYRSLPVERRQRAVYRAMTSTANQLLKKGVDADTVKAQLMTDYVLFKEQEEGQIVVEEAPIKPERRHGVPAVHDIDADNVVVQRGIATSAGAALRRVSITEREPSLPAVFITPNKGTLPTVATTEIKAALTTVATMENKSAARQMDMRNRLLKVQRGAAKRTSVYDHGGTLKRALVHDRKGTLYVSTKGLLGSITVDRNLVITRN